MDGPAFDLASEAIGEIQPAIPGFSAVVIEPPGRPGWRERVAHPVAIGIAAAVHLGVLALMWPALSDAVGDGGTTLEAIAVSVVDRVPVMSAPAASVPENAGEPVLQDEPQPDARPASAADAAELKPSSPPDTTLALPPEPELPPDDAGLPVKPPEPQIEKQPEATVEPPREDQAPRQQAAPSPPPAAAPTPAFSAAEASPGVAKAYERQVARLLEERKPGSKGRRGRLLIQFLIDAEGRPQSVIVVKSSDDPPLDARTIAAVQRLAFPPPPHAMTSRQRTFKVPYEYR